MGNLLIYRNGKITKIYVQIVCSILTAILIASFGHILANEFGYHQRVQLIFGTLVRSGPFVRSPLFFILFSGGIILGIVILLVSLPRLISQARTEIYIYEYGISGRGVAPFAISKSFYDNAVISPFTLEYGHIVSVTTIDKCTITISTSDAAYIVAVSSPNAIINVINKLSGRHMGAVSPV